MVLVSYLIKNKLLYSYTVVCVHIKQCLIFKIEKPFYLVLLRTLAFMRENIYEYIYICTLRTYVNYLQKCISR